VTIKHPATHELEKMKRAHDLPEPAYNANNSWTPSLLLGYTRGTH
jgi:hypothetical protein